MISSKTKYWLRISLLGIAIIVILSAVIIFIGIKRSSYYQNRIFTTNEWIIKPNKRYELIKDLNDSKKINGKTKREVISILGEPNTNIPASNDDKMVNGLYSNFPDTTNTGVNATYYLGTKPGIMEPELFLFIWFENDTVSKYIIRGKYN